MRKRGALLFASLLAVFLMPFMALAADTQDERGLVISPLRSYLTIDAGDTKTRSVTVSNMTNKQIDVTLTAEQFSVADYAYDYSFRQQDDEWVKFVENHITLKPFESYEAGYTVSIPAGTAPGGRYYSLFANAELANGSAGKVRVASLLYVTINGTLTRTSELANASVPWFITTPIIPYEIAVKNTGNIHYFAAFGGVSESLGYKAEAVDDSHLLMPGTTRTVKGSFESPLLPGIYKITVGYKPDGQSFMGTTRYILFFPLWTIIALLLAGFGVYKLWRHHKNTIKAKATPPTHS